MGFVDFGTRNDMKESAERIRGGTMKRLLSALIFVFCLSVILQIGAPVAFSAAPVLFFSDLTWGPKTGWEGSQTKGAAVTIWGKNFGSTRGSNYVTVNGAQITEYAEWGVIGPARSLERITFWLNTNCTVGDGTVAVTVNGVTSNPLPFKVMDGVGAKIYFISVSTGNNSNNGLYSSPSGSNGPFKDILKFNPANNPSGDSEPTIFYVKAGTYTALEEPGAFVALRGPYSAGHALIAYPGETPTINTTGTYGGFIWDADYEPYGKNSYFTYSKFYCTGGGGAIGVLGDYNRVIGCTFMNYLEYAQTGIIFVTASKYTSIYGNLFDHNGYSNMEHNIYVKTQRGLSGDRNTWYTYIGWNEFSNAISKDLAGGVIFISKESATEVENYYTQYVFIHDNYFHDGEMEFIYTGDNVPISDIYIYNNIFRNGTCDNTGVFLAWHTVTVFLYNNVFYQIGVPSRPMVYVASGIPTTATFKNNIFYSQPGQEFINVEAGGATANSDHDLFYNPGGTTTLPSGVTVTNPIVGDPLFMDPRSYNFHLQPGSPAFNTGTSAVSAYVTQDYDGISRPRGALYDIGAFEYDSGGDITPPAKPTKLIVIP
jgi:hypothetical protein